MGKYLNILGLLLWCYACLFAKKHKGKIALLSVAMMFVR